MEANSDHLNLSNAYITTKEFEKAKQHIFQALKLNPHYAEGYHNLGRIAYKQNLFSDAVQHFKKALRINPNYWEAHMNLANTFTQLNQSSQAQVHYQETVRLKPDYMLAYYNLGLLQFEINEYIESERNLKTAIELGCREPMAIYYLAQSELSLGNVNEAIYWFESIIKNKDNFSFDLVAESYHNLGVLYLKIQEKSIALAHFEQSVSMQPNNDTAKHMILALKGNQEITEAPTQYVTALFDQYADYYDEHVKHSLNYSVPGLLRNAVGRCLANSKKPSLLKLKPGRVLDIGCGSGLCGIYFRDLALELVGIDLSPNMVEKATQLRAYENVICGDFNEYLDTLHHEKTQSVGSTSVAQTSLDLLSFDLIIAGDVLVYKGDLSLSFQNIAKALKNHGLFAFTLEELNEVNKNQKDNTIKDNTINENNKNCNNNLTAGYTNHDYENFNYFLQPSGRFAHSLNYIECLASMNNLSIEISESIILRLNQGNPIVGRLLVLMLGC